MRLRSSLFSPHFAWTLLKRDTDCQMVSRRVTPFFRDGPSEVCFNLLVAQTQEDSRLKHKQFPVRNVFQPCACGEKHKHVSNLKVQTCGHGVCASRFQFGRCSRIALATNTSKLKFEESSSACDDCLTKSHLKSAPRLKNVSNKAHGDTQGSPCLKSVPDLRVRCLLTSSHLRLFHV